MTTTNKRQQEIIRKREYWIKKLKDKVQICIINQKTNIRIASYAKLQQSIPTKVLLVDRESNLVYKEVSVCRLQNTS